LLALAACHAGSCVTIPGGRLVTRDVPSDFVVSDEGAIAWRVADGRTSSAAGALFAACIGDGRLVPHRIADAVADYKLVGAGTVVYVTGERIVRASLDGTELSSARVPGAVSLVVGARGSGELPVGVISNDADGRTLTLFSPELAPLGSFRQVSAAAAAPSGQYVAWTGCGGVPARVCVADVPSSPGRARSPADVAEQPRRLQQLVPRVVDDAAVQADWALRRDVLVIRKRDGTVSVAAAPRFESRLLASGVRDIAVAPDASWFAYVDTSHALRTRRVDGGEAQTVDTGVEQVLVAPTGDRLGYFAGCSRATCTMVKCSARTGGTHGCEKISGLVSEGFFNPVDSDSVLVLDGGLIGVGDFVVTVLERDARNIASEIRNGDARWLGGSHVAYVRRTEPVGLYVVTSRRSDRGS
jgi:hypothetical protein